MANRVPTRLTEISPWLWLALAACFFLVGCRPDAEPNSPAASSPAASSPAASSPAASSPAASSPATVAATALVRYALLGDLGAAKSIPAAGWSVRTDRDYTVVIERAEVANYTVQLVACEPDSGPAQQGWLDWLVAPAYAGHGDDLLRPGALYPPVAEALAGAPAPVSPAFDLPTTRYCHIHYLLARASDSTVGAPADGALRGRTLHVRGTYAKEGAEPRPFLIQTTVANAALRPMSQVQCPDGGGNPTPCDVVVVAPGEGIDVRVIRRLDRWFDGLDFDALPPRCDPSGAPCWPEPNAVARHVLRRLIEDTRFEIHRAPPSQVQHWTHSRGHSAARTTAP